MASSITLRGYIQGKTPPNSPEKTPLGELVLKGGYSVGLCRYCGSAVQLSSSRKKLLLRRGGFGDCRDARAVKPVFQLPKRQKIQSKVVRQIAEAPGIRRLQPQDFEHQNGNSGAPDLTHHGVEARTEEVLDA